MSESYHGSYAEPFQKFYDGSDSQWGNSSGPGSDSFHTTDYRALITKFIRLNSISSIVDIGCGDWQFSRFIDMGGANYVGLDVVRSVVERNRIKYESANVNFGLMPDRLDNIPQADLLIMKDVLQHLPNSMIFEFQKSVFAKFKHCLLTNSFKKLDTTCNIDIPAGEFRCLDLLASPFNFRGTYILEFGSSVWEHIRVLHYAAH